jgi:uncharacterized membrane protein (DUF2068 family)
VRFHPKRWNEELWICSLHGHRAPAANVKTLRSGVDDALGVEVGNLRLARCLRCDAWVATHSRTSAEVAQAEKARNHHPNHHLAANDGDVLPEFAALPKPRRGHDLEEAITMRLIALWRGAHAVVFALVAGLLLIVKTNLAGLKTSAGELISTLDNVVSETARTGSSGFFLKSLQKVSNLESSTVTKLIALMVAYGLLEGVEGWGLWKEKRWAEYLTVVATAGLIPFEIHELTKEVTVFRVGALVLNIAVIIFLVRAKRLFGVSGGKKKELPFNWETEFHRGPSTGRVADALAAEVAVGAPSQTARSK